MSGPTYMLCHMFLAQHHWSEAQVHPCTSCQPDSSPPMNPRRTEKRTKTPRTANPRPRTKKTARRNQTKKRSWKRKAIKKRKKMMNQTKSILMWGKKRWWWRWRWWPFWWFGWFGWFVWPRRWRWDKTQETTSNQCKDYPEETCQEEHRWGTYSCWNESHVEIVAPSK